MCRSHLCWCALALSSVTYEKKCFPSIALFFVTIASVKFTIQEHVFLLQGYYELNHNIKLLREEFEQECPN